MSVTSPYSSTVRHIDDIRRTLVGRRFIMDGVTFAVRVVDEERGEALLVVTDRPSGSPPLATPFFSASIETLIVRVIMDEATEHASMLHKLRTAKEGQ